jgi:hypothetical protein
MAAMAQSAENTLRNLKAVTGYFGGISALINTIVDVEKTADGVANRKFSNAVLYFVKTLFDIGTASANLLTALSSSAPLIARIAGQRVAWLGKVGAGIEGAAARVEALAAGRAVDVAVTAAMNAAAEEAGVVIGERATLLLLGRAVLYLSGWEVAIVITVIQLLIAYWEDNDLQSWLEKCAFGKLPNSPPWTAGKQHEGFEKALKAVGLQVEGAKE